VRRDRLDIQDIRVRWRAKYFGSGTVRNHVRNDSLRNLVREARWTHHSFAVAVNGIGAEAGVALHYDRTTVSHWLAGSRPRPPVPEFVAEALSRRLGRSIGLADAGLADTSTDGELPIERPCGFQTLHDLVMADLDPARRAKLRELPFRAAWAVATEWCGDSYPGGLTVANQSEAATVTVISAITSAFATGDRMLGGGHARSAVAAYLATGVAARLRPGAARRGSRAHVSAAAALTQLIGFMCFDNLHHNLAQRYYRAALQLAQEAHDIARHVAILQDMSVQALFLGHYQSAAQLAETAVERASALESPSTRAALLGQAAVCRAAFSQSRQAFKHLADAEKSIEQAGGGCQADRRSGLADLEHRTGLVLAFLQDLRRAEAALANSLRHRPEADRRSRMLTTYQLADVQLRRTCLEQACMTWQQFLSEYPYMDSARINFTFRRFRLRLQEHRNNETVRRVLHQASGMAGWSE
jgi:hypothetical protein